MYGITFCFLVVFVAGFYKFNMTDGNDIIPGINAPDVRNSSYAIGGQTFTLVNGKAEKEISPNSASKQTVLIFGEPVYGDLNADGKNDAAIVLESIDGGSGTFYYAALAIASGTGYIITNTLLIGDRITPQTIELRDGRAVYNYAVRKATETMITEPSAGKSLWVHYDLKTGEIGELIKDFEEEVNPAQMTLGMKKWSWIQTKMNDGTATTPKKKGSFTIVFNQNKTVSIGTDCNSMGGAYTQNGNKVAFGSLVSTMMFCDGSQEAEFSGKLSDVRSYLFTSKGELILETKMDSGTMIFR